MALSVLEIEEEDCGSGGMPIIVLSKKHAETLVHKYYKINESDIDWKLLDFETAKKYINNRIIIRSPMTCTTPNFKMCKKCFGEKYFPTKYLGIVSAQCLAERITQLIMRSFHTSGAASLEVTDVPETAKEFIKNHLIDINNNNNITTLVFDTNEIPPIMTKLSGFCNINNNEINYHSVKDTVMNKDAVATMNKVKDILKSDKKNTNNMTVSDYYSEFMSCILQEGNPYSSFVEILFANMLLSKTAKTTNKEIEFWRYNQHKEIAGKLGDKTLANAISKLLGLLYHPNKTSLSNISLMSDIDITDTKSLSVYEKIWLGEFSL